MAALAAWLDSAAEAVDDARIACLATTDAQGMPDARMVIMRAVDGDGLLFHTSLVSAKVDQMEAHPGAALVLWWEPLMRQARVRGPVARLADGEADARFARLPRGSQIAAWASDQRAALADRAAVEAAFAAAEERFPADVPRPDAWGVYRLVPDVVELWQGHPADGMHDRFHYERRDGGWTRTRIAP